MKNACGITEKHEMGHEKIDILDTMSFFLNGLKMIVYHTNKTGQEER